jgi:hypothetical protein
VFLVIAALHDHNKPKALELMETLAQQFPDTMFITMNWLSFVRQQALLSQPAPQQMARWPNPAREG